MQNGLEAGEFHGMFGRVNALGVHVGDEGGEAFVEHGLAHVGQSFGRVLRAVEVGGAASVVHDVEEGGVPDVGGDVAVFRIGLGHEGAERLAVGVAVHAYPRGLACALQVLGAGVGVGDFHVHHARADAPAEGLTAGVVGAVGGVEQIVGRGAVDVEPMGETRGQNDAGSAHQHERGFGLAGVDGERAADASVFLGELHHGMVIEHGDAVFLHLFGEHGLLLAAVEFQEGAGLAGQGVSLEVPAAEGAHVDAPFFPLLHDVEAFQKVQAHEFHVLGLSHEAVHEGGEHGFHVVAVDFGNVAAEMIVARGSGAGTLYMALFQHDHALGSAFGCGNGGHGPADASANDDDIGLNSLGNRNHDFASWDLRESASTCSSVNARGIRSVMAPLGQSSTQESQCQHSSGNLT